MPTASATAKTQPRAHMPLSGRRFGSFAGKTVLLPTTVYPRKLVEGYQSKVREGYATKLEDGYATKLVEGRAS